jgi:hypothetical protein
MLNSVKRKVRMMMTPNESMSLLRIDERFFTAESIAQRVLMRAIA